MNLQSRRKIAHDRCVDPVETIARLEALIRPHHDYWLHEETLAEHLHWTAMFIEGLDFRAMGKGTTLASSTAGALAEGAEWLAAQETGDLPGYVGGREPEVPNALPIEALLGHIATATPPVIERIRALDEAWHWVDGWSLIEERTLKVPLEYVRLIGGPNGKATGNNLEEAIVHATHEIFERRAQITVLRHRMVVPTIDVATVEHPIIREQLAFLRSRGIEVILKDLSFGGVLPCLAAYFVDRNLPDDYQFRHFFKVGASFDREEALLRTFTEYTQGRRPHEFITPDSADCEGQLARLLDHDFRRLRTQENDCDNFLSSFMFGFVPYRNADFLREGDVVPFEKGPQYADCLEDISHAREICETLGKDYIVVDLTDPEIGFPVVQVIVPGYSDVLPFHPMDSHGLFQRWTRTEVLNSYPRI
ncbi:MAG: ribosomal protein methylthiotransferase accessory factor [Chthoniobacter sp.]|jgi:ribosomal protein S12 methylthiotransferase accessory factor YcaO|nr:ribosomal protein methylthiotransferase accessory factor [Chthoniobacter sp.]